MDAALAGAADRYFEAERRGALALLGAGLLALAGCALLWMRTTPYRGAIPPLALFGLVEAAVGAAVALRTPRQATDLRAALDADEAAARAAEGERMRRVLRSFRAYKAAEMVTLTAGLTLAMLFPRHHALYAAGIACVAQGSLLLVVDRRAERQADDYAAALARPDPAARRPESSAPR